MAADDEDDRSDRETIPEDQLEKVLAKVRLARAPAPGASRPAPDKQVPIEPDRVRPLLITMGSPETCFAGAGQAIPLDDVDSVHFGRIKEGPTFEFRLAGRDLHVGIPYQWASKDHADLAITSRRPDFTYALTDLGSLNGTSINGARVEGTVPFVPGHVFEVGHSFWTIREVAVWVVTAARLLDPTGTASPQLRLMERALEHVAQKQVPILLVGDVGSGKQYLARSVHALSGRSGKFVHADLLTEPVERLAGVGGWVNEARGGTLFLDDVGELSEPGQEALLRVLDQLAARGAEVRVIAATTCDLRPLMATEEFSPDLYQRLAGHEAVIPPLRDRREDLGLLLRAFLQTADGQPAACGTGAFRQLLAHHWPFNVRELKHTIVDALAVSSSWDVVTAESVGEALSFSAEIPTSPERVRATRCALLRQIVGGRQDRHTVAKNLGLDLNGLDRWLRLSGRADLAD